MWIKHVQDDRLCRQQNTAILPKPPQNTLCWWKRGGFRRNRESEGVVFIPWLWRCFMLSLSADICLPCLIPPKLKKTGCFFFLLCYRVSFLASDVVFISVPCKTSSSGEHCGKINAKLNPDCHWSQSEGKSSRVIVFQSIFPKKRQMAYINILKCSKSLQKWQFYYNILYFDHY